MPRQRDRIDTRRTYLPLDPDYYPENIPANLDFEQENRTPLHPYDGRNILPLSTGYTSFFGTSKILGNQPLPAGIQESFVYKSAQGDNYVLALGDDGVYSRPGDDSLAADPSGWYWTVDVPDEFKAQAPYGVWRQATISFNDANGVWTGYWIGIPLSDGSIQQEWIGTYVYNDPQNISLDTTVSGISITGTGVAVTTTGSVTTVTATTAELQDSNGTWNLTNYSSSTSTQKDVQIPAADIPATNTITERVDVYINTSGQYQADYTNSATGDTYSIIRLNGQIQITDQDGNVTIRDLTPQDTLPPLGSHITTTTFSNVQQDPEGNVTADVTTTTHSWDEAIPQSGTGTPAGTEYYFFTATGGQMHFSADALDATDFASSTAIPNPGAVLSQFRLWQDRYVLGFDGALGGIYVLDLDDLASGWLIHQQPGYNYVSAGNQNAVEITNGAQRGMLIIDPANAANDVIVTWPTAQAYDTVRKFKDRIYTINVEPGARFFPDLLLRSKDLTGANDVVTNLSPLPFGLQTYWNPQNPEVHVVNDTYMFITNGTDDNHSAGSQHSLRTSVDGITFTDLTNLNGISSNLLDDNPPRAYFIPMIGWVMQLAPLGGNNIAVSGNSIDWTIVDINSSAVSGLALQTSVPFYDREFVYLTTSHVAGNNILSKLNPVTFQEIELIGPGIPFIGALSRETTGTGGPPILPGTLPDAITFPLVRPASPVPGAAPPFNRFQDRPLPRVPQNVAYNPLPTGYSGIHVSGRLQNTRAFIVRDEPEDSLVTGGSVTMEPIP